VRGQGWATLRSAPDRLRGGSGDPGGACWDAGGRSLSPHGKAEDRAGRPKRMSTVVGNPRPPTVVLKMSETARLGSDAMIEAHEVGISAVPFEGFFEQERDQLYRALWLVTRNRFEAEELTQEAFVRVLERWDRVSEMDDPHAYLFQTAMNAFRSSYGRALLAARRTIGVMPSDEAIAHVDERDALVRALAPLSPRQRASLVLTDLLGFSSEQAARMLGIRPSTVRMHTSRARAALKETMSRD
jgi:RNA polymerase sigma-70 factor, ECF subfamily